MRLSLLDLLLAIACIMCGEVAAAGIGWLTGLHLSEGGQHLLGIPLGVLVFLAVTPTIYRRFRLLPLFLPVCPHCKKRPPGYWILESKWPRVHAKCGACQQLVELWWRRPAASDISTTMPSLVLSWPHSVGRWKELAEDAGA